jgi:hypothetical protein
VRWIVDFKTGSHEAAISRRLEQPRGSFFLDAPIVSGFIRRAGRMYGRKWPPRPSREGSSNPHRALPTGPRAGIAAAVRRPPVALTIGGLTASAAPSGDAPAHRAVDDLDLPPAVLTFDRREFREGNGACDCRVQVEQSRARRRPAYVGVLLRCRPKCSSTT